MIVYVFFFIMLFLGLSFFCYGMMMEYQFYVLISTSLGLPEIIVPLGFYILIASVMFFIATPLVIMLRIKQSGSGKRVDATPRNKGLFDFIYRDGDIRDVYGDRVPGLGLFRILKLGLIFDTGREPKPGSVYNIPGKKLRFALQDINFTPNAKFAGFYSYLNNIGFNNMTEVNDVLSGYNPELMVKIWNNMCMSEMKGPEDYIVERMQTLTREDIKKNNVLWKHEVKKPFFKKKQKTRMIFKKDNEPISPIGIINKAIEDTKKQEHEPKYRDPEELHKELDRRMNK